MDDRLEQLRKEKNKIDLEIKKLIEERNTHGKAKIVYYCPSKNYAEWRIALRQTGGLRSWKTIASSKKREDVIDMIPQYISDLTELYKYLKDNNNEKE